MLRILHRAVESKDGIIKLQPSTIKACNADHLLYSILINVNKVSNTYSQPIFAANYAQC